eukprot:2077291-Alexandrium_andersonii.AAC.1
MHGADARPPEQAQARLPATAPTRPLEARARASSARSCGHMREAPGACAARADRAPASGPLARAEHAQTQ